MTVSKRSLTVKLLTNRSDQDPQQLSGYTFHRRQIRKGPLEYPKCLRMVIATTVAAVTGNNRMQHLMEYDVLNEDAGNARVIQSRMDRNRATRSRP